MDQTQRATENPQANSSGVSTLSQTEVERVAGGNFMPTVAKYGDLRYVGPTTGMKVDLAEHLGLKDLRKPDYLYERPRR